MDKKLVTNEESIAAGESIQFKAVRRHHLVDVPPCYGDYQ